MIRKIIILVFTAIICICPIVSADDFDIFLDNDKYVTYSYNVKNREAEIGGQLTYTITITNHTKMYFEYFYVSEVFKGSYLSFKNDEDEFYNGDMLDINPYETITVEYTRTVPEDILWYKKDGEYYIDFSPCINYATYDHEYYEDDYNGNICEYFYNYEDENSIPIKITNIKDGSEYAQLSIVDDRHYLPFSNSSQGSLFALTTSIASFKNTSDYNLKLEHIKNSFDDNINQFINCTVEPNKSILFETTNRFYMEESELSSTELLKHQVLFSIDDGYYYAVSASKALETMKLSVADIYLKTVKDDDSTHYIVVNNSDKDIDNFAVDYFDGYPESYADFKANTIMGTFKANSEWIIPVEYTGVYNTCIITSYYIEDFLYSWEEMEFYVDNHNADNDIYNTSESSLSYLCKDFYIEANSITLTDPESLTKTETDAPLPTYTPYVRSVSSEVTAAPETTAAPTPLPIVEFKEVEKYYIPKWVWFALSGAFLAVVLLVAYVVLLQRKDTNEK